MSDNPLRVSLENIIPLTEARDHFSQIVTEVQKDKLYVLTKGGKPAVAIIDVKYLEQITGGNVNPNHVETEIQKNPAKVGRVEMISHKEKAFTPAAPTQTSTPMPNPPRPPAQDAPARHALQGDAGGGVAGGPKLNTPVPKPFTPMPVPTPKPFTPTPMSPPKPMPTPPVIPTPAASTPVPPPPIPKPMPNPPTPPTAIPNQPMPKPMSTPVPPTVTPVPPTITPVTTTPPPVPKPSSLPSNATPPLPVATAQIETSFSTPNLAPLKPGDNPKPATMIDMHPMDDIDDQEKTKDSASQSDNNTSSDDKPNPAQYSAANADNEPDDMMID